MTTLLVDADIFAYTAASRNEKAFDFGLGTCKAVGSLADAAAQMDQEIEDLINELRADDAILCLSCSSIDGWRKAIYPPYKEGRKPKPELIHALKDHMRVHYRTFERPTMEADDILGILATHPKMVPGKKIVVSIDKDLRSVPCNLYNPQRKTKAVISEADADYMHMMQTLMGDSTDGYPGIPGVGPKKAEAILFGVSPPWGTTAEAWGAVVAAYLERGLTEADALLQARVARICRWRDYDYKRKRVKLWSPPLS